MEKIKNVFSKCGAWIKAHAKIVIAVLVVLVVAIVVVNLIGGSEKRTIKKYISALNSYDAKKIEKAMNVEGKVAFDNIYYSTNRDDEIENFGEAIENVDDSDVDEYKDKLDDKYDKEDKGKVKYKLIKVVSVTKAKDNKDLKKVVAKIKTTSKPDKDDDDDDDDSIWEKEKSYKTVSETYASFYIYKGKIIDSSLDYIY